MQHRYAVHAISRFIEHYGNGVLADDATDGWFAPLRDAVLAAESEVIPVVDDAEQAEALVCVALDLIDLSLTGPGLDKPHRKAREAVRRYLERIGEVVVDRERVRGEIQTARDGLLGEVLVALGYQGGTRQQALDEIRRLRASTKVPDPGLARPAVGPRTDFSAEEAFAAFDGWGVGPQTSESLSGQDTPTQDTPPQWALANLPIGSVTAFPDGTLATVRQPYGWDLATDSEGTAFHVSSSWGGHKPCGEVVLVGTGEIPEEWTWTYDGVAALVRDWVARRNEAFRKAGEAVPVENVVRIKTLAATLLAQAEAATLQAEKQPDDPMDGVEPPSESAPEPVATIVSDEASSRVEWLRDLPIGTITVDRALGMVSVRLPDGWDVAVGADGAVYGVAPSPGMEPLADDDVVRIGTGTVPDSWLTSHAEVAEIARAWLVERGVAVPSSLASEPLVPIYTDDDGDCPI